MFSYIIPFHSNDYLKIAKTLKSIRDNKEKFGIHQVLLCHNGKLTFDWNEITPHLWDEVQWVHTDEKGYGAGCKMGIPLANQKYVVLTGSDLPFSFTDIESFLKNKNPLAIGSKLHPQSEIAKYELKRKLSTYLFWLLRKTLLPVQTPKDSQGTVFLETELAKKILPQCVSNDYLLALEIISWCQKEGVNPVELPIQLENHDKESSVSLWKDGTKMLKGVYALSKRLRNENK